MNQTKNMLLITAPWGENEKTFKLMPLTSDCPYIEAIFNAEHNVLAVISKDKKDSHFMVQKLNDEGAPEINKAKSGYKQQRVTLPKYYEYYITEQSEIDQFVELVAANSDTFDYKAFYAAETPATVAATIAAQPAESAPAEVTL
jgi:hypothetical protein